ncbi:MAG: MFS transporter [Acidimicrobiales bacterium]
MSKITGRTDGQSGKGEAFSSLRVPEYKVLWWGGLFSFMAVQMQFLLRSLLAWDLTESEASLGQVYLFFGLSMLIATPLGGVAADRLPKRAVLIGSQVLIATAAMGMGLAVVTGRETFWMLLLAAVAQGSAFGFFGPARTAFTRDLVGREQLGNAISLSMLSMNGTRIFAPSIAGALAGVAFIGIGKTYLIAGAFSVISLLAMLRLPNIAPAASTKRNPFLDIADGVRYVAARPPLRRLVLSSLFVIMFAFNYVAFMPALIEGEFGLGEGSVGLMSTASAIGAVAAFAPVARRADSPVARLMMICSGFGFGIGVMLLGLAPNLAVAMLITAGIGVMTNAYQSLSNTLALAMSDETHQGRVQSLMQLSFAGFGMAAAPLGILAEAIGLRQTLGVMGLVAVASMGAYVLLEQLAGQGLRDPAYSHAAQSPTAQSAPAA